MISLTFLSLNLILSVPHSEHLFTYPDSSLAFHLPHVLAILFLKVSYPFPCFFTSTSYIPSDSLPLAFLVLPSASIHFSPFLSFLPFPCNCPSLTPLLFTTLLHLLPLIPSLPFPSLLLPSSISQLPIFLNYILNAYASFIHPMHDVENVMPSLNPVISAFISHLPFFLSFSLFPPYTFFFQHLPRVRIGLVGYFCQLGTVKHNESARL